MKWALALLALLAAQPALADDECKTFTSELWEPGDRTVHFADDGSVVIKDQTEGATTYSSASIGTGIPGRALLPINGPAEDGKVYIEHKGDVIIDNEVFTPFCEGA